MNKTQMLLKAAAVRRDLDGVQMSPEALRILERHVQGILLEAKEQTLADRRRRIDGVTMRRVLIP
ncbi:unnamed protein product [marine sediment metagenome]|uniref:Transcription factor CBF/NF-Y/archaeal histone domain-containing protein n=1 Tax=marine sediment metagenome TaxID=412755 RepID=X1BLH9_9ZZZZ